MGKVALDKSISLDGFITGPNPRPAAGLGDGGASPGYMYAGADAVASHIPNAERRTLAGQEHSPAADVLDPELVEFFTTRGSDTLRCWLVPASMRVPARRSPVKQTRFTIDHRLWQSRLISWWQE
jgi:hypothetical protein